MLANGSLLSDTFGEGEIRKNIVDGIASRRRELDHFRRVARARDVATRCVVGHDTSALDSYAPPVIQETLTIVAP